MGSQIDSHSNRLAGDKDRARDETKQGFRKKMKTRKQTSGEAERGQGGGGCWRRRVKRER